MKGIPFTQANDILGAPKGMEKEVYGLPIYRHPDEPWIISCWELTPEELAEVQRTGVVYLHVWSNTTFPVSIEAMSPFPETSKPRRALAKTEKTKTFKISKRWALQIRRKHAGLFSFENVPDMVSDEPMYQAITVFGISLVYFGTAT
jgi:hypothetical protein